MQKAFEQKLQETTKLFENFCKRIFPLEVCSSNELFVFKLGINCIKAYGSFFKHFSTKSKVLSKHTLQNFLLTICPQFKLCKVFYNQWTLTKNASVSQKKLPKRKHQFWTFKASSYTQKLLQSLFLATFIVSIRHPFIKTSPFTKNCH